ncbi:MAG TPA: DUF3180 domain-containing protein, partial [Microbacteriaceae bacterium]
AVVWLALGYFYLQWLLSAGQALVFTHPLLAINLFLTGAIVYSLTLRIASYQRKLRDFREGKITKRPARPDPIWSFRLLVLSKSVAYVGSGFLGWHLGALVFLVMSTSNQLFPTLAVWGTLSSLMTVVAGILSERNLRTPDDLEEGETSR